MKRKFLSGLCATTALTLMLTGCGGSASNSSYDSAYSDNDYYEESYDVDANYSPESYGEGVYKSAGNLVETALDATTSSKDAADSSAEVEQEAQVSGEESVETGTEETGTEETTVETETEDTSTQRKLITTMNIDAETYDLDAMMDSVEKKVSELGGYIEESSISMNTNSYSYYYNNGDKYYVANTASFTIRVPDDKLQNFVDSVEAQSNITYSSSSSEDVTLQYADIETRIKALRTEEDRLLDFMEKAETIEDMMSVEDRLTEVQYELQSYEAKIRTMDNKISYSTINLSIDEVKEYTVIDEENRDGFFQRIADGFMDSLTTVINGFKEFIIWFISNIPHFVVWGALIAIIVFIVKKLTGPKKVKKNETVTSGGRTGDAVGPQGNNNQGEL